MKTTAIAITLVCATFGYDKTEAAIIWSWSISDPVQVVSVTDAVVFRGTLYNDITSTEHLYGANNREVGYWVSSASCCNAAMRAQYVFSNPGIGGDVRQEPNFISQFYELDLAPGHAFEFVLLNLTPRYGSVALGRYDFSARLGVTYGASGIPPYLQYSATSLSIIVSEVALPAAGPLFLGGSLALLRLSRRTKASASGTFA